MFRSRSEKRGCVLEEGLRLLLDVLTSLFVDSHLRHHLGEPHCKEEGMKV
jgi:hypothetical protein